MVNSSLCDHSNVYILVKGTIAVVGQRTDAIATAAYRSDKIVLFKNCALFSDCISEINNTKVDRAKNPDAEISMCNLIEYNNNYSI